MMNGSNLLIDTNIALYLLNGDEIIAEVLDNSQIHISFITQLELLGYTGITKKEHQKIEQFVSECLILDLNDEIKRLVIEIKQTQRVKLPDAIIAATAIYNGMTLITADKGFKKVVGLDLLLFDKTD